MIVSNEYKDWSWDAAQEFLLNSENLTKIKSVTTWDDGFLVTGERGLETQVAYFVWLDDVDGWSYKQFMV